MADNSLFGRMGRPRVVDLFAGAGGFSEGARAAGCDVVWAANHWQLAVDWHAQNHPSTAHLCQDLHQANWLQVPEHDIALASPSCQGHTAARGTDKPHHDAARSTAWAVVSCLEVHRTPIAIVENVPGFLDWTLYPAWEMAMRALGYHLQALILDAADFGVPQHRIRLFIVATLRPMPALEFLRVPHRPIRGVIRWDEFQWSPIDKPGRAAATLARIARGRQVFGDTFLAPYYGSGSGETGRSLDRPLGTVTTRDRYALIRGDKMRMLQPPEYREAMGFPVGYRLPAPRAEAIYLLGNAVCPPVATAIIRAVLETSRA